MRTLVGCETSGVVRRAFSAKGHEVWSVDTLPSEDNSSHHIIGDVRDYLNEGWDLGIFHPPCTYLTNSGVRWLHKPAKNQTVEERWKLLDEGAKLFSDCWNSPIPKVCVENPIMHKYARERIKNYIRPQIVQPWWFGHKAFKATGLHLRGLMPLEATNRLQPPKSETPEHKEWNYLHYLPPSKDRWKIRSKTFQGIANAMAEQWGDKSATFIGLLL